MTTFIAILTSIILSLLILLGFSLRDLSKEIKEIRDSVDTIEIRLIEGEE